MKQSLEPGGSNILKQSSIITHNTTYLTLQNTESN